MRCHLAHPKPLVTLKNNLTPALEKFKEMAPDALKEEVETLSRALQAAKGDVSTAAEPPRTFKVLFWAIYAVHHDKILLNLLDVLLSSYHTISPSLLTEALTTVASTATRGKPESKYGALQYALQLRSPAVIALLLSYYDKVVIKEIAVVEPGSDRSELPALDEEREEKVVTPTTMDELTSYFEIVGKKKDLPARISPTPIKKTLQITLANEAILALDLITRSVDRNDGNSVALLIRHTQNPADTLKDQGVKFLKQAAGNSNLDMLSVLSTLFLEYTDLDTLQATLVTTNMDIAAIAENLCELAKTEERQHQEIIAIARSQKEEIQKHNQLKLMQEKEKRKNMLSSNKHWLLFSQIKMGSNKSFTILVEEYKKLGDGFLREALSQNNAEALVLAIQIRNIDILATTLAAYFYVEFKQQNPHFVATVLSQLPLAQLNALLTFQDPSALSGEKLLRIRLSMLSGAVSVNSNNVELIANTLCADNHAVLNYAIKDGQNLGAMLEIYSSVIGKHDYKKNIGSSFCDDHFSTVKSLLETCMLNKKIEKNDARALYQFVIAAVNSVAGLEKMKLLAQETRRYRAFHAELVDTHPELAVSYLSKAGVFARSVVDRVKNNAAPIAVATVVAAVTTQLMFSAP